MTRLLLLILLALSACTSVPRNTTPHAIFNGENLDGWVKRGGDATYCVEEGCIVGRRGPGPNTFLCTARNYDNFDLELDFRWDEVCNSGIQFRSKVYAVEQRVGGYQCELDPSKRSWSCGLFYEGPEGRWIDPLDDNEPARKARRLDDWNHIRIRADGPRIQTWLNGVPCIDYVDPDPDTTVLRAYFGGRTSCSLNFE
jgi:hypothetical protein